MAPLLTVIFSSNEVLFGLTSLSFEVIVKVEQCCFKDNKIIWANVHSTPTVIEMELGRNCQI